MMNFSHLPLRFKLGIAFGVLALMVIAVSVISLFSLGRSDSNFEGFVSGVTARTALAAQLRAAVDSRAISARNLVLVTKPADVDLEKALVVKSHEDVQSKLKQLKELARSTGASEKALELIGNIDRVEQAYGSVALGIVSDALSGNKADAIAAMNDKCRPLLAQLVKASDEYAEFSAGVAAKLAKASDEQYAEQRNILIAVSATAVLLAVVAGYLVTKSITVPVRQAVTLAESVASGDLTHRIKAGGKDEVSQLLLALGRMSDSLSTIVSQVGIAAIALQRGPRKLPRAILT